MTGIKTDLVDLRTVAKRVVEETPDRPGRQYLLVDSDLIEELAKACGAVLGSKSRREQK